MLPIFSDKECVSACMCVCVCLGEMGFGHQTHVCVHLCVCVCVCVRMPAYPKATNFFVRFIYENYASQELVA